MSCKDVAPQSDASQVLEPEELEDQLLDEATATSMTAARPRSRRSGMMRCRCKRAAAR